MRGTFVEMLTKQVLRDIWSSVDNTACVKFINSFFTHSRFPIMHAMNFETKTAGVDENDRLQQERTEQQKSYSMHAAQSLL